MIQRGRKSMAALSTAPLQPIVDGKRHLVAARELTPAESVIWQRVVAAHPGGFEAAHGPLLTLYCQHVARAGAIEVALARLDPVEDFGLWAKLSRLSAGETGRIVALARVLRLLPQVRPHRATAAAWGSAWPTLGGEVDGGTA